MAGAVPVPHTFPSTALNPSLRIHHPHRPPPLPHPPRASSDPGDPSSGEPSDEPSGDSAASFERRVSQVRLKYRSGTGKKAEQRRAKKSGSSPSSSATSKGKGKGKGVLLPPAPLREAVSAGGVPVEVGFSRYSERLNGRVAALGLAALLLVELGSGRSLLAYHPPPVLFLQLYSVAAVSALFVKFEKERISIWPQTKPPSSSSSSAPANSEP